MGGVGEMFPGPQQVSAHGPQRVASAPAVAAHLLLAPAAHLGERLGGETFDTEPVRHPGRLRREVAHGGFVAGVGVDHHRLNAVHTFTERRKAGDQHFLRAALDEVPQPGRVEVHRPVTKLPWRPKVVSSIPKRRGGRCGNPAIFARASAAIARHAVDQLTLKVRATAAVERSHAARAIAAHNRQSPGTAAPPRRWTR